MDHDVSAWFDMEARDLPEVVRASVHYYNDEDEIERFCAAVRELAVLEKAAARYNPQNE